MKKPTKPSAAEQNVWDDMPETTVETPAVPVAAPIEKPTENRKTIKASVELEYDIEGLMTDFPTAKELERFVYDETGVVLNLKGRANKLKYQVAMDVLNGQEIDPKFIGDENPYIDKTELVPIDPLGEPPARDPSLPARSEVQNVFISNQVPHTDFESRAQDKKISVAFRKYRTGEISYEIQGPLEQRPYGTKIDKYGRERPEVIKWVDPRSGEQLIVRRDGSLTPQGRKLRALLQTFKVNNSNYWDVWVDREFVSLNDDIALNPWADE